MIDAAISGLVSGYIYIVIGLGVVLVYRFTSNVNFAHGAIATACAYTVYAMTNAGISYWLAAVAAVLVGAILSVILGGVLTRFFLGAGEMVSAMVTLGPALALIGICGTVWGYESIALKEPWVPSGSIQLASFHISSAKLVGLTIALILIAAISVWLNYTRTGLLLRAVADSRAIAASTGVRVVALERLVWGLGGALAGFAALTVAPSTAVNPALFTSILLTTFAAAVLGGLASFGGLAAGGILLGLVIAVAEYLFHIQASSIIGLIILVLVLALRPQGLFGLNRHGRTDFLPPDLEARAGGKRRGASRQPHLDPIYKSLVAIRIRSRDSLDGQQTTARRDDPRRRFGRSALILAYVLISILALSISSLLLSGPLLFVISSGFILAIAIGGQNMMSGVAGMFSVAQGGFMVLAAYVAGLLSTKAGMPQLVSIFAAIVTSALMAWVIGVAVLRLAGLYLAMVTLVAAMAIGEAATNWRGLTGGADGLLTPTFDIFGIQFGSPRALFLLTGFVAVSILGILTLARRSKPIGLTATAVRDSAAGAASIGIDAKRSRLLMFVIGGGAAGLAGSLAVFQLGAVTPSSFGLWASVYILFAAALGGTSSTFVGPIIGGVFIAVVPYFIGGAGGYTQIIFGAIVFAGLLLKTTLTSKLQSPSFDTTDSRAYGEPRHPASKRLTSAPDDR